MKLKYTKRKKYTQILLGDTKMLTIIHGSQTCQESTTIQKAAHNSKKASLVAKWQVVDGKLVCQWIVESL
jgi:hypothetical protein